MKLQLAQRVVSRAMSLLHTGVGEYDRMGALVRRRSLSAARECSNIGSDTDLQFEQSLKEFLAFFSVIAVNELAIRSGERSEDELRRVYERLASSICESRERDKSFLQDQATVRRLIREKHAAAFDHWFYGYWNADFVGMRVTEHDLAALGETRGPEPAGSYCTDAALILLARVARLETLELTIPPPSRLLYYDRAIQRHVASFVASLNDVFGVKR
ncbi:MAG: hypothetical protein AB9869_14505 [Verrucomicrobiia bacterium]